MKGFIFKQNGGTFYLRVNDKIIASSEKVDGKHCLSTKNCKKISLGYDLDELAEQEFPYDFDCPLFETLGITEKSHKSILIGMLQGTLQKGFQKAFELMGDKKFTEKELIEAIAESWSFSGGITDYVKSLQQTEWEVEVEMEWKPISDSCTACASSGIHMAKPCDHPNDCCHWQPKLDENGCLILKRVD